MSAPVAAIPATLSDAEGSQAVGATEERATPSGPVCEHVPMCQPGSAVETLARLLPHMDWCYEDCTGFRPCGCWDARIGAATSVVENLPLRWEDSATQVLVDGELTMARRLVGPWVAVTP